MRMINQDNDEIRYQKLGSVANGVLIGIGIIFILPGAWIGIVSIVAGVGLEIWKRSRIGDRPDKDVLYRQKLFSLLNGILIGVGLTAVTALSWFGGMIPIIGGVGLEVLQRRRLSS